MELWKDILNYEGHYQISSYGRVKSLKWNKEKILVGGYDQDGYHKVNLSLENKTTCFSVQRLVAQAFLGLDILDTSIKVDHINGNDVTNNKLDNLQLLTNRGNISKQNIVSSSKYVGVSWNKKNKKWITHIYLYDKNKYLGLFNTEEQAHQAYLKALDDYNVENKYSTHIKKTTK